jgi:hypothetical protein
VIEERIGYWKRDTAVVVAVVDRVYQSGGSAASNSDI